MEEHFSQQELMEFDADIDIAMSELDLDEADLDFDEQSEGVMDEIEQLAMETGIATAAYGAQGFSELAADEFEQQFIFNWIKKRAKKAVESAYRLYKKYGRRCAPCAAKITETLALFKAGKWVRATIAAVGAIRCIRRCVKG